MQTFELDLDYKGKRPYIRGADIFHQVTALGLRHTGFGPDTPFRLAFREIITRHCHLILCDPGEAAQRPENFSAECLFGLGPDKANGWLVQGPEPVTARNQYLGDDLTRPASVLDGRSVSAPALDGVLAMDQAVAMTKMLCEALIPPRGLSWILTRLEMDRLDLDGARTMRVDMAHNMKDVFTKCALVLDGTPAGILYFSLVDLKRT